jgi:glycosyltransferase involved in cell wall biosynthesis
VLFQCWSTRQQALVTRLRLFDAIDTIAVLSDATRDLFERLGAPAARLRVLRFGVDHRFYAPRPDGGRERFALSLGEARHRDYAALFAAASGLDLALRVSARGYQYARETRARQPAPAPPPNVDLLPFQTFTELRELYARAAFVVLALRDVRYPAGVTAALEAMAMGCAVIVMSSRGLGEYVLHGETGLVVAPDDLDGLRAAMRQLAADPALAHRLGTAGRRRVETEINQARYVAQLASLCGAGARAEDAA